MSDAPVVLSDVYFSRGYSTDMKVIPADASTVMLLRACPDTGIKDIEVLMVRRTARAALFPVFMFSGRHCGARRL